MLRPSPFASLNCSCPRPCLAVHTCQGQHLSEVGWSLECWAFQVHTIDTIHSTRHPWHPFTPFMALLHLTPPSVCVPCEGV